MGLVKSVGIKMAEIIRSGKFWMNLVTVIGDHYIPALSDQCLANGLISREVFEEVLELNTIAKDRSRRLLMAICDTIDLDNSQFELLTQILKKVVNPFDTTTQHMIADMERAWKHSRSVQRTVQSSQPADSDQSKVKAIKKFTPQLVHVIADSVDNVSDHCWSNGLISYGTYRNIICSGKNPDDKARMLLLEIMKNIHTDRRCFNLFITALKDCLPTAISDRTRMHIADEIMQAESKTSTSVPAANGTQSDFVGVLKIFEKAIAQVAEIDSEKDELMEDLKSKTGKIQGLKSKLGAKGGDDAKIQMKIDSINDEIIKLMDSLKRAEEAIKERHMHMKRERAIVYEQNRMAADLLRKAEKLEEHMHMKLQLQFQQELDDNQSLLQEVGEVREEMMYYR